MSKKANPVRNKCSHLVFVLSEIPDSNTSWFGAKAVKLAQLKRLGFPVPPGFCISGEAYRTHLMMGNLSARIQAAVNEIRASPSNARQARLTDVRKWITDTPVAVELRTEIEIQYRVLDSSYVAIRSSSTAEDLPAHSFAGLYNTFLGKADVWTCFREIKNCWASLWSDRAFEYREKNRFDHLNANMAVLVQKLIPAESAGVVFTANPVSGRVDQIVIESCFGMGEPLVSGKVLPDRFVLAKQTLRILETKIGIKKIQVTLVPNWGIQESPVEEKQQGLPSIDESDVQQIGKLARKVEKFFGVPQDIEWLKKGNEILLLQSRPITVLQRSSSAEDHIVWTNINIGEAMPEAAPPMSHSVLRMFAGDLLRYISRMAGVNIESGDMPIFTEIAGREYFNVNVLFAVVRSIPIVNRMKLNELLGGLSEEPMLKPENLPEFKTNRLKFLTSIPRLIFWFLKSQPEGGHKGVNRVREVTDELQRSNFSSWRDEDLPGQVTYGLQQIFDHIDELGGALTGLQYFTLLTRVCRKWFSDPESTIASKLLTGIGDIQSAQAGLELWHLAETAGARPELKALIQSGEKWITLRSKLADIESGEEFLKRWDNLIFYSGHHCQGEFDISKPRWRDQPDFVLEVVRGFLNASNVLDPVAELKRRVTERERLVDDCRHRLRNPLKRWVFDFLLKRAQLGAGVRENLRDEINRRVGIARMALLELGERFVKKGIIDERNDIFFLYEPELIPVLRGIQLFDVRKTIAARKTDFQHNIKITLPTVIVGKFKSDDVAIESINIDTETLSGLAVCPGIVTGPARVIAYYHQKEQVLPGEILVAPFTDPGWTPYFLPAAGVVVDIGGMLSHGSIVLREYGKPTVVNVGPATKIIKTGQMVQVDGNHGKVRILR